ncbi:MAG: rod-binding protein [Micropepsaceae bacterium]
MSNLAIDLANFQQTAPHLPGTASRKLEAASKDFESVFLSQMLQTVWDTVPTDGAMGGGMGESVFRSLMIQDIGKQMAQQGGIGLASNVKSELLRMQEGNRK